MKCEAFNFDMDCAFRLFSDGLSNCLSDFILGEFNFGGPVFFHCSDICAYGGFHFIGFSEVKNRSLTSRHTERGIIALLFAHGVASASVVLVLGGMQAKPVCARFVALEERHDSIFIRRASGAADYLRPAFVSFAGLAVHLASIFDGAEFHDHAHVFLEEDIVSLDVFQF